VRTKRGQVDEIDERPGLDDFAVSVQRPLDVSGEHGRGHQSNGQRHYDMGGLSEEQYPAKIQRDAVIVAKTPRTFNDTVYYNRHTAYV